MSHFYQNSNSSRDPGMAATLSLVPGLGQFYNGQSRKGILFLDVAVINFAIVWLMIFNAPITSGLTELGKTYGMKLNASLISCLQQMQFGTPGSFVVLSLIFTFVAFAVRDAYEHASKRRRRALYGDSVIDLTEATSGAYIFHFSLLVATAIFAMFFFVPKPAAKQLTEIEFLPQTVHEKVHHKPVPTKAPTNAINHGQVKRTDNQAASQRQQPERANTPHHKAEAPSRPSESKPARSSAAASASGAPAGQAPSLPRPRTSASSSTSAPPVPQPLKSVTPPTPSFTPRSAAVPATPAALMPTPARLAMNTPTMPSVSPRMPNPLAVPVPSTMPALNRGMTGMAPPTLLAPTSITAPSSSASMAVPMPVGAKSGSGNLASAGTPSIHTGPIVGGGSPSVGPAGFARSSSPISGTSGTGAPSLVRATGDGPGIQGTSGGGPVPKAIGPGGTGTSGPGTTSGPGIMPSKSRGTQDGGGTSGPVIVPTAGGPTATTGSPSSPRKAVDQERPSVAATEEPNFGPYMQELQRRIKRAWFPAKVDLSHRVVVLFKIHTDGTLTDLVIRKSSGISRHDQAALQAVQNAAPFAPLPKHSPESVDIEFTFDYNVFNGR